jgi:hypothetical protein
MKFYLKLFALNNSSERRLEKPWGKQAHNAEWEMIKYIGCAPAALSKTKLEFNFL